MSVTSVKLKSWDATGDKDKQSETRVYVVECSAKTDTPTTARKASGVPQVGDAHPSISTMKCISNSAKYEEDSVNPWVFEVTANFETPDPADDGTDNADPDDDDVEFSCSGVEIQYPIYRDIQGKLVQNSAGDAFDPVPNGLSYDEEITITKSQTSLNPVTIASYRGAVNSSSFTVTMQDGTSRTFEAKSCRMGAISYTLQSRNGVQYWRVTYPIMYRKPTTDNENEPWAIWLLDEGLREKDGTTVKPIKIGGKDATSPVKLDGAGAVLANQSAGNGELLKFYDYNELDFGTLSLTN
jgi:hypothetical protein